MSVKKKIAAALLVVFWLLINAGILLHTTPVSSEDVNLHLTLETENKADVQVYYSDLPSFGADKVTTLGYDTPGEAKELIFPVNAESTYLRLDLGNEETKWVVSDASYEYKGEIQKLDLDEFSSTNLVEENQIASAELDAGVGVLVVETEGEDPFLVVEAGPVELLPTVQASVHRSDLIKNAVYAVLFNLMCLLAFRFRKKFSLLPIELIQNRALILNLSKNDFKTKYAGSYLGIIWAFIQPIVTVLVYWFVFSVGLRSPGVGDFPFVLWLIAGLVPWFFFQDTLNAGTNALLEYNYLVKKVVFKISILPIVKAISALFVHAFFVAFMLILYSCYGKFPDLYTLQILYYSGCMFVLVLGICYATCAIVIFFRDLTQIINIVLQVGVWMTPIMWNIDTISMPAAVIRILKLNPMYYVVTGYRDALINKIWFWEHFDMTIYFWIVTAICFVVGTIIFKRLKVHFADVL